MLTPNNNVNLQIKENSVPTTFKALMCETSVYNYFVELKEDALTKKGFFDLVNVPCLYVTGAGHFLKNLRIKHKLRPIDIAKILNISRETVYSWENNHKNMPLQSLVKIAEVCNVSRAMAVSTNDKAILPSLVIIKSYITISLMRCIMNTMNCLLHIFFYIEKKSIKRRWCECYETAYVGKEQIIDEIIKLVGNTKTSPAKNGQTVDEYLQEPQPHLNYLINAPKMERKIALRVWASTEGYIGIHRDRSKGYHVSINPELEIGCARPDLVTQLHQIARRFNINFAKKRAKINWSGINGLHSRTLISCINFLKLGGFIKGVAISSSSKYHEGIDKDILLLGILEFKRRQKANKHLRKLTLPQIHYKTNQIIKNREYKSADYYINYYS